MWAGIAPIIERVAQDPKVRVIVIRGQGSQAFCAGADISEFDHNRASGQAANAYDNATGEAVQSLYRCAKPVVAAIQGICFGGGFALALGCDLRLASDVSRFCIPAGKLGIGYGLGATAALVQRLGPGTTADILLTGQVFSAAEAVARGIVQRVAPADQFQTLVDNYVAMLSENAPLSLAASKVGIRATLGHDPNTRAEAERAVAACVASEDYKEGRAAFMAKRKPRFEGR